MEVWKIAGIRIQELYKTYQMAEKSVPVFSGLNLELDRFCITVVVGRSGCGKTTLLRMILGLEPCDRGTICQEDGLKTGIVFQEPRLMPWLNTWQNIGFGVKKSRIDQEKMKKLLLMTGLAGFEKAYPFQLSGGMQQRTALARALFQDPDYILMDEPFAALDYFTRAQMQQELLNIYKKQKKGILFVTHSIEEALTIGTHIVVLENGICEREYHLETLAFPRDLLSGQLIELKRELIERM